MEENVKTETPLQTEEELEKSSLLTQRDSAERVTRSGQAAHKFQNLCEQYGKGEISAKEFDRLCNSIPSKEYELTLLQWSRLLALRSERLTNLLRLDCPNDIISCEFHLIEQALTASEAKFRLRLSPDSTTPSRK